MVQAVIPSANITAKFPMSTMVFFQFVFAAITVVLLAGGVLARMNFRAWMIFCPLWLTFSYTVGKFPIQTLHALRAIFYQHIISRCIQPLGWRLGLPTRC